MAESYPVLAPSMLATCGMLSRMRWSPTHKHAKHVRHAPDTCPHHANWKVSVVISTKNGRIALYSQMYVFGPVHIMQDPSI